MKKQCLIVDDEAAVCQMVERVLTSAGMEAVALTRSSESRPSQRGKIRDGLLGFTYGLSRRDRAFRDRCVIGDGTAQHPLF